ncbi:hypothetical protein VTN77DRAFT_5417 [Rasamsonia byssochlamydoides]|uniref:uncharacterized protein n=1 Tax=Rasamsonia byssochlamydoides TaxID=89139 RepID=UPI00374231B7
MKVPKASVLFSPLFGALKSSLSIFLLSAFSPDRILSIDTPYLLPTSYFMLAVSLSYLFPILFLILSHTIQSLAMYVSMYGCMYVQRIYMYDLRLQENISHLFVRLFRLFRYPSRLQSCEQTSNANANIQKRRNCFMYIICVCMCVCTVCTV